MEKFFDVDVGRAKMIDPAFLVEERLDFLIIGDIISEENLSVEIQNWLHKFWDIVDNDNLNVKAISGFYISPSDVKVEPFWVKSIYDNVKTEIIYPPILRLKLNRRELALENGVYDIVKEYSNDFIEFLINKKNWEKKRKH